MSTCKDCLHYEVCDQFTAPNETYPEVGGCKCFKNKADYMQIRNSKYKTMKFAPIKIHGKWVKDRNKRTCSICGFLYLENGKTTFNFCPNCGKEMDGKEENNA